MRSTATPSPRTVMAMRHNCGNQGLYGLTWFFPWWYERHPVNVLFACEWAEPLGERLPRMAPRRLEAACPSSRPPSGRVQHAAECRDLESRRLARPPPRSGSGGLDGWTVAVGSPPAAGPRGLRHRLTCHRRSRTPP